MMDVAIIGAGELGGALAHVLARRDVAASIRLVDEEGQIAAGKALDIMQAAPIQGFTATVSGATDLAAAAGAPIIAIADRAGASAGARPGGGDPAEWQGEDGLVLLRRIARLAPRAIVVCAGGAQRDLVERGVGERLFAREQLFGSAPEALAGAVRAVVALETNAAPHDVALTVLGVPPSHLVVPWEEATIGGFAAMRLLDEPTRRRLAARVAPLWPPGSYALASAAAKAIDGVAGRSRRIVCAFVAPDDQAGRRTRTAALPVRLGPRGIAEVLLPALSGRDRVALDNAMLL